MGAERVPPPVPWATGERATFWKGVQGGGQGVGIWSRGWRDQGQLLPLFPHRPGSEVCCPDCWLFLFRFWHPVTALDTLTVHSHDYDMCVHFWGGD